MQVQAISNQSFGKANFSNGARNLILESNPEKKKAFEKLIKKDMNNPRIAFFDVDKTNKNRVVVSIEDPLTTNPLFEVQKEKETPFDFFVRMMQRKKSTKNHDAEQLRHLM